MLLIVNPQAATVSDRLKNLVVYALQGRFEVEVVNTEGQNHATLIGFAVHNADYDLVVAFGGDGTLNEIVNAFAGTDIPVSVLPGGSSNVASRMLGIPNDIVDATEHLLALVDDWEPRKIDLGKVDGRHFVSSCGAGIDAAIAKRINTHPSVKAAVGPYYFGWAALSAYYRGYLHNPVRLRIASSNGESAEGITAITQNSDPFTYLAGRPVRVCKNVAIADGTLAIGVLERMAQRDIPSMVARIVNGRKPVVHHRRIMQLSRVMEATITSISSLRDGNALVFPVQVDGEYIGEKTEMTVRVEPGALTVVA